VPGIIAGTDFSTEPAPGDHSPEPMLGAGNPIAGMRSLPGGKLVVDAEGELPADGGRAMSSRRAMVMFACGGRVCTCPASGRSPARVGFASAVNV
jgi:hypothetical protein